MSDKKLFTMRQLLEAGVHFGHHVRRWDPRMSPYLYGSRGNVHIINLERTVPMLDKALKAMRDISSTGGRVLFVGTKRHASKPLTLAAKKCGQPYINHRWLGGILTNWKTVSHSIKRLRALTENLEKGQGFQTKKERLSLQREHDKLERALGGIKDMGGLPNALFIVDVVKEDIAVAEAVKLNIPVIGVTDSNANPEKITYPIPGNDDSIKSITLYCHLAAEAILKGISDEMAVTPKVKPAPAPPAVSKTAAQGETKEDKAAAAKKTTAAVSKEDKTKTAKAPAKKADAPKKETKATAKKEKA